MAINGVAGDAAPGLRPLPAANFFDRTPYRGITSSIHTPHLAIIPVSLQVVKSCYIMLHNQVNADCVANIFESQRAMAPGFPLLLFRWNNDSPRRTFAIHLLLADCAIRHN